MNIIIILLVDFTRVLLVNVFRVFLVHIFNLELFFRNQGGEMLYARCVGLAEDVAYPLKPPLLKQQGHIQEKQKAMNQRP